MCYGNSRKAQLSAQPYRGWRFALVTGGSFPPPDPMRGGLSMVTYSDLIQTGILIVGIIALFIQANNKK